MTSTSPTIRAATSFALHPSLYWIFDEDTELDYYYVEIVNGVGNVTFTDLDPKRTHIVALLVRDNAWNSRIERREGYPNGMGVVVNA